MKSNKPSKEGAFAVLYRNISQTPSFMLVFAAYVLLVTFVFIFSGTLYLLDGTAQFNNTEMIVKMSLSIIGFYGSLRFAVRKKMGAILVGIYLVGGIVSFSLIYYAIALGLFASIIFMYKAKLE